MLKIRTSSTLIVEECAGIQEDRPKLRANRAQLATAVGACEQSSQHLAHTPAADSLPEQGTRVVWILEGEARLKQAWKDDE